MLTSRCESKGPYENIITHNRTNANSKMGKGQNEGGFSEEQIQMYKDCFKLMDINKDGTLDKNDLRGAFDNVGVLMTEGELDSLLLWRRPLWKRRKTQMPRRRRRRRRRPPSKRAPRPKKRRQGSQHSNLRALEITRISHY